MAASILPQNPLNDLPTQDCTYQDATYSTHNFTRSKNMSLSNFNLESDELYHNLQQLGIPDIQIENLTTYFKTCDEIMEDGIKTKWLDDDDYMEYLKIVASKKSMGAGEIERLYGFMAKIVVTKYYTKVMPGKIYYTYHGVSELVHDCIQRIVPNKY